MSETNAIEEDREAVRCKEDYIDFGISEDAESIMDVITIANRNIDKAEALVEALQAILSLGEGDTAIIQAAMIAAKAIFKAKGETND